MMTESRLMAIVECLGWGICPDCSGPIQDENQNVGDENDVDLVVVSSCQECGFSVAHQLMVSDGKNHTFGFAVIRDQFTRASIK